MWHYIGLFFGAALVAMAFLTIESLNDNRLDITSMCVGLFLISMIIVGYSISTLYEDKIEIVNVTAKFIDTSSTLKDGFIDDKNIEYQYSGFDIHTNTTYKMKIRHDNDLNTNKILYIYT